jgi:hypothetical protein
MELKGRPVGDRRSLSTRENGRHEVLSPVRRRPTDPVDAAEILGPPPMLLANIDLPIGQSGLVDLPSAEHSMLAVTHLTDVAIHRLKMEQDRSEGKTPLLVTVDPPYRWSTVTRRG